MKNWILKKWDWWIYLRSFNTMKIKQLVKHLFRCRHGSSSLGFSFWSVTACNGYGIETEQKCLKCGAYRHRLIKMGCDASEEWRDGKLNKSAISFNSERGK